MHKHQKLANLIQGVKILSDDEKDTVTIMFNIRIHIIFLPSVAFLSIFTEKQKIWVSENWKV